MKPKTAELWAKQDQHQGDRRRLFTSIAGAIDVQSVFYPGCYVDIAPSFVFESVTYLDSDKRAPGFFKDREGVLEIVARNKGPTDPEITFIHADYSSTLDLPNEHFDLLVSLYAGLVSDYCTKYLKIGGVLLVNPSHGDAAMASIDPRYELTAVVNSRAGDYRVTTTNLETYLIPRKPVTVTVDSIRQSLRGIGYTKSPFAYLFTRVS